MSHVSEEERLTEIALRHWRRFAEEARREMEAAQPPDGREQAVAQAGIAIAARLYLRLAPHFSQPELEEWLDEMADRLWWTVRGDLES